MKVRGPQSRFAGVAIEVLYPSNRNTKGEQPRFANLEITVAEYRDRASILRRLRVARENSTRATEEKRITALCAILRNRSQRTAACHVWFQLPGSCRRGPALKRHALGSPSMCPKKLIYSVLRLLSAYLAQAKGHDSGTSSMS